MKYRLQDLIDMEQFQNLQDRLNEIYSFPSAILDNDGNILIATAWQDICTQFHRKHPDCERECLKSDQYILSHLHEANPAVSYRCPHGLMDNATPIIIDGIHYGNFFTGQFFLEKPDMDFFRAQAKKYRFDESAYLKAVKKVPIWTLEHLNKYLFFIKGLIAVIAESGLKKLKETELRKRIEENEERYHTILLTAMDGFWIVDMKGRLAEVNAAYCRMIGYTREEILRMSIAELEAKESKEEIATHIHQVMQDGWSRFERQHRRKDGHIIDVELSVHYLPTCDGRIFCFLRDITERKAHEAEIERLNRLYLALSQVNQLITRVKTKEELLSGICEMLMRYGHLKMAWIGWHDPQTQALIPVAQHGDMDGYLNEIKVCADDSHSGRGPTGTAIREARSVVCNDFLHDDATKSWHEAGVRQGFGSAAAFPIWFDGVVCGALTVYAGEVGFFCDKEILLFEEVAMDVSFALDHLEKEKQRQRADEALRMSEAQKNAILNGITTNVALVDKDLKILWANKAAANSVNKQQEDLLGHPCYFFWGDPAKPCANCPTIKAFHTKQSEHRIVQSPNGKIWDERGEPVFDAQGNVIAVVEIAMDITERKRAEDELRKSEARFRRYFELPLHGIAITSPEKGWMEVNGQICSMLGYTREELVTMTWAELTYPDDIAADIDQFERLLSGHIEQYQMEKRFIRKDGIAIWTRLAVGCVREPDSKVDYVVALLDDITDRKRAEAQIKKLSSAVEQSPVCIVITDITGAIEYVNPKFTHLTGYTLEEVQGQNPRILKGDKTSADEYRQLWESISHGREWRGEFHNRKKNSDFYWESASISPIVDNNGRITHFLAVKEDITERKAMEEQFRQAQKLESIGQLAGGVAHDFNNILAVMMIRLSFLQKNKSLDAESLETVIELTMDAKRSASMTKQLLLFSRRSVMEVELLDLNELVSNLLKMVRRLIGEHITVRFNCRDYMPFVEADTVMLEQVLMNLSVNASDAMPNGGSFTIDIEPIQIVEEQVKGNIKVQPGQFVCLSVADTGCGMDETTLKRIFEPFFTTKEIGKGTGLGLATVHGIVAQHKGWVEVESELGKGTTFKVFLPATTKKKAEPAQTEKMEVVRGHETILLVEDEIHLRQMVAKGLRRFGYSVLEADNGQTAMKLWLEYEHQIDLLFSDMRMPEGMTGLDLAKRLKDDKPNLQVIISTGYSMEMAGQGSPTSGGIVYFQKPYEFEALLKIIRDCLDRA